MKKRMSSLIAMLLAVSLLLAACGGAATPDPAPEPEAPEVEETVDVDDEDEGEEAPEAPVGSLADKDLVVLTPSAEHGWIAGVIFFAEEAGRGLDIGNYRVITSASVAEQAGQLDEVIDQGVDAVVLFPHSDELSHAAQRVVDAGIPLFVFNRNVDADFTLRLLGSNRLIGRESARFIAEGIGGEGVVAYLAVPAVGSTSEERIGYFHEVMQDFPDIELVTMTSTAISIEEGLSVTADMLTANPHVDAIFTIDDSLSIGALQAIREAGRTDIQFINGSGGAQIYLNMIRDTDDITLLTATFAASMIADTIALAVEYLEGRRDFSDLFDPDFPQPNVIIIPPTIITRDNVEQFLAPDSPW